MTDTSANGDGFLSRVRVIETQPLSTRAAAYVSLHDELAKRLDVAPTRHSTEQSS